VIGFFKIQRKFRVHAVQQTQEKQFIFAGKKLQGENLSNRHGKGQGAKETKRMRATGNLIGRGRGFHSSFNRKAR